jgi:hypothetical protein
LQGGEQLMYVIGANAGRKGTTRKTEKKMDGYY